MPPSLLALVVRTLRVNHSVSVLVAVVVVVGIIGPGEDPTINVASAANILAYFFQVLLPPILTVVLVDPALVVMVTEYLAHVGVKTQDCVTV
jgi:hypothetical protein